MARSLWKRGRWAMDYPSIVIIDVLPAAALLVVSLAYVHASPRAVAPIGSGAAMALSTVGSLALLVRRRRPLVALLTPLSALALALAGWGVALGFLLLAVEAGVYSVARHSDRRTGLSVALIGMTVLAAGLIVWMVWNPPGPLQAIPYLAPLWLLAWTFGAYLRTRRGYLEELEARAVWLEQSHEAETLQAVAEERTRIARELHDIVAHHVSVIALQAAAARAAGVGREQAAEALGAVETEARAAGGELNRLLGVLRRPGAEVASREPPPGLDGLGELVDHACATGLEVRLEVLGERRLSDALELSAYRIVQEALTNVIKHARAPRCTVTLRHLPRRLEIEVADDGDGTGGARPGHGLIGMRERVVLFGGRLDAGPAAGGGFRVHAVLPVEEDV